jgi:hypothetical protein
MAPIIIPTRPLEITGPSTLRGICIADVSAGRDVAHRLRIEPIDEDDAASTSRQTMSW